MKETTYEERLYEMTRQFTTHDIQRLLDARIDAAGLLAMPVFAGVISLGHVLYGFEQTDRDVFLKFCQYRMKIALNLGKILYDNMYQGLIVQWCSRSYITLVNSEVAPLWSPRSTTDGIEINALHLCQLYIEVVSKLPVYSKLKKMHLADSDDSFFAEDRKQIAELCLEFKGE